MAEQIGLEGQLDLKSWDRDVDKYLRDIDKMNSRTGQIAGAIGGEFSKMGGVIVAGIGAATAAIAGVAALGARELTDWTKEGVQSALELEQQMAFIAATMGETTDAIEPLNKLISDLALDPNLKVSATEAADAIELLARNGLDMTTILGGAAKQTVLLANATKADFGTAADLVTDVMAIFNIKAENMAEAVDGVTSVVNNSKFSIDDYRLALARGGVAAQASGVSFKDFNSIIAFTAAGFSSGQTAGTGWASLLTRLVPQSEKAGDAMKELGIITETGANRFFDANGQLKDMSEIIDVVNGAFGGLTEEQRIAYAQMIFGRDAAEALFSMIGKTGDEFEAFQATLGDTSALQNAETATGTLSARMEVFSDLMDEIQRQSGRQFFEVLGKITEKLIELGSENSDRIVALFGKLADMFGVVVERMMPLVDEWFPKFLTNAEAVVGMLAQWVSGENVDLAGWLDQMTPGFAGFVEKVVGVWQAFQTAQKIIGGFVGKVQEWLQPVADFVAKHVELSDVLLVAGASVGAFLAPLGLAIAQMAAVGAAAVAAAALVRTAWERDLGGVRTTFEEIWPKIQQPINDFTTNLMAGDWPAAWSAAQTTVVTALEAMRDKVPEFVKPIIDLTIDLMIGHWPQAWETAKGIFSRIVDGMKSKWDETMGKISDFFGPEGGGAGITEWFQTNFPESVAAAQRAIEKYDEKYQSLMKEVRETIEAIDRFWTNHGETIQQIVDKFVGKAIDSYGQELERQQLETEAILNLVQGDWQGFWDNLKELNRLSGQELKDIFQSKFGQAADAGAKSLDDGADKVATASAGYAAAATKPIESIDELFETTGQDAHKKFTAAMEDSGASQEAVTAFLLEVMFSLEKLPPEFYSTGGASVDKLVMGLAEKFGIAEGAARDLAQALMTGLLTRMQAGETEASQSGDAIGKAAATGMATGITSGEPQVTQATQGVVDAAETTLNQAPTVFDLAGTKATAAFSAAVKADKTSDAAVQEFVTDMQTVVDTLEPGFLQTGRDSLLGFVEGMARERGVSETAAREFATAVLDAVEGKLETRSPSRAFIRIAGDVTAGFKQGLDAGVGAVVTAAQGLLTSFLNVFNGIAEKVAGFFSGIGSAVAGVVNTQSLFNAGQNIVQGFIDGVSGMIGAAQSKIAELASLAAQAAEAALGIQSPSKVFMELGRNTGLGFLEGLEKGFGPVPTYLRSLLKGTIDLGDSPYIAKVRPVLNDFLATLDPSIGAPLRQYLDVMLEQGETLNDWIEQLPADIGIPFHRYVKGVIEGGDDLNDWIVQLPANLQPFARWVGETIQTSNVWNDWLAQLPGAATLARSGDSLNAMIAAMNRTQDFVLQTAQAASDMATQLAQRTAQAAAQVLPASAAPVVQSPAATPTIPVATVATPAPTAPQAQTAPTLDEVVGQVVQMLSSGGYTGGILNQAEHASLISWIMNLRRGLYEENVLPGDLGLVRQLLTTGAYTGAMGGVLGSADSELVSTIMRLRTALQDALAIHSPSGYFEWLGQMSGQGFVQGLAEEMGKIPAMMQEMFAPVSTVNALADRLLPTGRASVAPAYSTTNINSTIGPFHVYNQMDMAELEFRLRRMVDESLSGRL